jgi:GrpB-like predicted nucleotidyltransferase (UPF0157 family)
MAFVLRTVPIRKAFLCVNKETDERAQHSSRSSLLTFWQNLRLCYAGFMNVVVVPYDFNWTHAFARESNVVATTLGETVISIHHIGSTAIPGMYAKPIVDMLVKVQTIADVDGRSSAMQSQGYVAMGEYGIAGRRYFYKLNDAGDRAFHIHVFAVDSEHGKRHLAFRDFLRAHADVAQQYSELKQRLAHAHPHDIDAYMAGKDAFIKDVQRRALAWCTCAIIA